MGGHKIRIQRDGSLEPLEGFSDRTSCLEYQQSVVVVSQKALRAELDRLLQRTECLFRLL